MSWITEGGAFMYIILGVSGVAFALILERLFSLFFTFTWNETYFRSILQYVRVENYRKAERLCLETKHPLAKSLLYILRGNHNSRESVESATAIAMQKLIPRVTKRTSFLQMFGNVATLLGLLGTIQGLTMSFASLAGASGAEKAELLAKGISTAMNTTAFGLVVAIPCVVAFALISSKENSVIEKYETTADEMAQLIIQKAEQLDDQTQELPPQSPQAATRGLA